MVKKQIENKVVSTSDVQPFYNRARDRIVEKFSIDQLPSMTTEYPSPEIFKTFVRGAISDEITELKQIMGDMTNRRAKRIIDDFGGAMSQLVNTMTNSVTVRDPLRLREPQKSEIIAALHVWIEDEVTKIKTLIRNRSNPLFRRTLIRWIERLVFLTIGALLGVFLPEVISDKLLNVSTPIEKLSSVISAPCTPELAADKHPGQPSVAPDSTLETPAAVTPPSSDPGSGVPQTPR